jgi:uncharacterized lipoprotein YehR (DUF1307 family)
MVGKEIKVTMITKADIVARVTMKKAIKVAKVTKTNTVPW